MGTIYRPTMLYPKNISLNMSIAQDFSCLIDGQRVTGYEINIYNNANNNLVYTSSATFSASNYLYDNDTLTITVPSTSGCTNGNEYKWDITCYNGSENVTSQQAIFSASSRLLFSISVPATVNTQSYEFVGSYAHSEDVPVRYWYYELYDSTGKLLKQTDKVFSSNIKHTFDGLFNGESYKIVGFLEAQNGLKVTTVDYNFNVSYTPGDIDAIPNVRLDKNTASVVITSILNAEAVGTYSFVEDFLITGNYGLNIDNNSLIYYEADTLDEYTLRVNVVLTSEFDGLIIELEDTDTSDILQIGFSHAAEKFYKRVNGVTSFLEELYPVTGKVYLIFVRPDDITIREYIYEDALYTTNDGYEFFDANEDFLFVQHTE